MSGGHQHSLLITATGRVMAFGGGGLLGLGVGVAEEALPIPLDEITVGRENLASALNDGGGEGGAAGTTSSETAAVGDRVAVVGTSRADLNGQHGTVSAAFDASTGRITVALDTGKTLLKRK